MTFFASQVLRVGDPEEGWENYRVTLGYENNTDQFRNESVEVTTQDYWQSEVATEEGYTYYASITEPWDPEIGFCVLPRQTGDWLVPTGVVPPGFRVKGIILHNYYVGDPCVSEVVAEFRCGETLHPETLTLRPTGEGSGGLGERLIDLEQPLQTLFYGPIDRSRGFDSLPATVDLGKLQVTIDDRVRFADRKMVFQVAYKNTDPAEAAVLLSPIVSVIDSDGYLGAPAAFVNLGTLPYPEVPTDATLLEYCPGYPIAYPGLGPLQEGEFQLCVPWNSSGDPGRRYFVVVCGSEEGGLAMDQVHQMGSHPSGLMGVNPDPPKECRVYEFNTVQ